MTGRSVDLSAAVPCKRTKQTGAPDSAAATGTAANGAEPALPFAGGAAAGRDNVDNSDDGDDGERTVQFADRLEYVAAVINARMNESKRQFEALRRGLVSSVPSSVLGLKTWQQLELDVCGNPTITVEDIRVQCRFEEGVQEGTLVPYLFEALEKFSTRDLSQFLRFVTGRKRLPAQVVVARGNGVPNGLPTSATCANTLYLPVYTSAVQLEARLRYAVYNCVAIDTDTAPRTE